MKRLATIMLLLTGIATLSAQPRPELRIRQITQGPNNHFFGYIGHVQNIPWNGNGRYILSLETTFQDRMPTEKDVANIVLIDTQNDYNLRVVDQSRGWNPQQGSMMYWNPEAPDTQFFFNDRDRSTGKVFCVLYDIELGKRIREYRFEDSPVGNGGVAQNGGYFLGINYARMARLRLVTGYPETWDWTTGVKHPKDDGVFKIDVNTGQRILLASFHKIAGILNSNGYNVDDTALFINHTLWNREGDRIFFFARGGWSGNPGTNTNRPFVMHADGSNLTMLKEHIGGHPEWDYGHRLIGSLNKQQIIYDADRQLVVGKLGNSDIFPNPEGDVALSPNGEWLVNGFKRKSDKSNNYVFYRRADGANVRSRGFNIGDWLSGDLRIDGAPTWNRTSDAVIVMALDEKKAESRQMFLIEVISKD
jgi:hypothetical protein